MIHAARKGLSATAYRHNMLHIIRFTLVFTIGVLLAVSRLTRPVRPSCQASIAAGRWHAVSRCSADRSFMISPLTPTSNRNEMHVVNVLAHIPYIRHYHHALSRPLNLLNLLRYCRSHSASNRCSKLPRCWLSRGSLLPWVENGLETKSPWRIRKLYQQLFLAHE